MFVSISLLLISTFRAPEGMDGLQSLIGKAKILIRFAVLGVLGFLLLTLMLRDRLMSPVVWHFPFLGFAAWGMISVLWSARPDESFGQVISLLTLILLSLAVSIHLKSEQDVSNLICFITLNLMGLCLFLLVTGTLIPSTHHMTRNGLGVGHSTNSGATASLGLVFIVGCWAFWSWRWVRTLLVPACLLFAAVSIYSANRLSMAITALLVPALWLRYGSRRSIGIGLMAVAAVGMAYLVIDPKLSGIQDMALAAKEEPWAEDVGTFSGRLQMWEAMWNSFLTSPWIGHGYFVSSATGELEVWFYEGELPSVNWTAHNIWLQALVSTGLVGLALVVFAVFAPIITHYLRTLFAGKWHPLDRWAFVMLGWYLLWGLLNESFLGPVQPESVIFFFVYGALIARINGYLPFADGVSSPQVTAAQRPTGFPRAGEVPVI
ncbi:MAG TPA: O-antigen ligase family protein [Pirellulaceae bacterium]|nr:O-antigen ligase family protein [Pirellulaceae bacterium]